MESIYRDHIDRCKRYLNRLSIEDRELLTNYTLDYYKILTNYLVSRINMCMFSPYDSTTVDFTPETTDLSLKLYKILINAPRIEFDIKLYHFFSHIGKYNRFIKVNSINETIGLKYKHKLDEGDKYIEPKFISTTYDPNVLKFLSGFSNYKSSCCYIEFIVPSGFPILMIPEEYSFYPYQKEVILPYGMVFRVLSRKSSILKLYDPRDLLDRIDKNGTRSIVVKDGANLIDKNMSSQQIKLDVKIINKYNIQFINSMLFDLYYKHSPNAHDHLHITRVMLSCLVFLKLYEDITMRRYTKLIYPVLYTALFHDSGRLGRDGIDLWERDSAEIAKSNLYSLGLSDSIIEMISKAIYNPDSKNILHMIFKGSDSLDIME